MNAMNFTVDTNSVPDSEEEQWSTPPTSPVPEDQACIEPQPDSKPHTEPELLPNQPQSDLHSSPENKDERARKPELSTALIEDLTERLEYDPTGLDGLAEEIDSHTDLGKLSRLPENGNEICLLLKLLVTIAENYPLELDLHVKIVADQLRKKITNTIVESGLLMEAFKFFVTEDRKRSEGIDLMFRAVVLIQTHDLFDEEMVQLWEQIESAVFTLPPRFWTKVAYATTQGLCDRAAQISGKPLAYFREVTRRCDPPVERSCGNCVIPAEAWKPEDDFEHDDKLNQLMESLAMPRSDEAQDPSDYFARINNDCVFDIMSNLDQLDLYGCSQLNRRFFLLSEASLSKAARPVAANLLVYRHTDTGAYHFQMEFRNEFYSMTLEDAMCGNCSTGAVMPRKMRRIPPPDKPSFASKRDEWPQKQEVTRAVSQIATKVLRQFDFASCNFYNTPLDHYLLDLLETVSSSAACEQLTLSNCWLARDFDRSNTRERLLSIIRTAKPAHLMVMFRSHLWLRPTDFLTEYARAVAPHAYFHFEDDIFESEQCRWVDPDREFVSLLWKFGSFEHYPLVIKANQLVAPFCTRIRQCKSGKWLFFIENGPPPPNRFAHAVAQEPDLQVEFVNGDRTKMIITYENTSAVVETGGSRMCQFSATFYARD